MTSDILERLRGRLSETDGVQVDHIDSDLRDAADEIERLRCWKAEAMVVLAEWEDVWVTAGRPGRLGASKAASVRTLVGAQ